MGHVARWPALFSATALMAGCGQTTPPQTANAQDEVLSGTEGSRDFGDHIVYFNALNTDQLLPEVASEYGIVRSKNRAMLTVSIHEKGEDGLATAVNALVAASAVNLTGQLKNMSLREITEEDAIYYIGELVVNDAETLIYTIDVTPPDTIEPLTLRFRKQFFVD